MNEYAIIDLYVPATVGSLEEIREAAAEAGLDGVVVVAESEEEAPSPADIAALHATPGPAVIPAYVILGPEYRLLTLLPPQGAASAEAVLEGAGGLRELELAVGELGGVALPVCPHQAPDGEVLRQVPRFPFAQAGMVALVAGGSPLARDLDFELAGSSRRRLLGATGPFGGLAEIGCFATFVPVRADEIDKLIEVLAAGQGIAVELRPWATEPTQPPERKRRRRRGHRGDRPDGEPPMERSRSDDDELE
jgi:hypothetical protein